MKTIPRHLKAISLVLVSVLTAPFALAQVPPSENSSGAISVDRSIHYVQTDAGQVSLQQSPYNFTFHVRGGSATLKTNWGPKFYKPGSGGVVQSGASSATNTGTLNFSNNPNNGSDFMFLHEFDTNAEMQSFYPIAPTDGGQYGVKFLGSSPPTPALFTDGLVYAAGTTYPGATPQIVGIDNDAKWSGGRLQLKTSGLTTLELNSFTEYSSTTYGSLIAVGIYDSAGNVVTGASKSSYYLPVGDSTEDPNPIIQPAITEVTLDGSWLIPGKVYTLELVYAIIAGRPEEANLNGIEFQGVSSYRRVTTITILSGAAKGDFDNDGNSDLVWQHPYYQTVAVWRMDGISYKSHSVVEPLPAGRVVVGNGDFNGDGKTDLVLQSQATNNVEVCMLDGTTVLSTVVVADGIPDWKIVGTGDFNGDGKTDLIWEHPYYSITAVWFMDGTYLLGSAVINDGGMVGWHVVGSGDFNGDGKSDLIWQHSTYGIVGIWLLNGTSLISTAGIGTAPNQYVGGSGDFNHDGNCDIILQNSSTGDVTVWFMNGLEVTSTAPVTSVLGWGIVNK